MLKHFITFLRFACQFFGFCLSNINKLYLFTDIFFANDLHLTSAAKAYLLIFGDSAGDDLGLDVLYDLITFCLCTFSDITLDIFLYRLFRFLCIFLFGLVEERLLIFTFGSLALCSEYFMLREYQCFKEDMIIFSETFIFDL